MMELNSIRLPFGDVLTEYVFFSIGYIATVLSRFVVIDGWTLLFSLRCTMDYGLLNRALLMMLTFDFTSLKCSFEMWTCIETHVVRKKNHISDWKFFFDRFFFLCCFNTKIIIPFTSVKCTKHFIVNILFSWKFCFLFKVNCTFWNCPSFFSMCWRMWLLILANEFFRPFFLSSTIIISCSISIINSELEFNEAHILWEKFSKWKQNFS